MAALANLAVIVVFAFAVGAIDEGIGRFEDWWNG